MLRNMNLLKKNILPICTLALLLSACAKEQALSEQVYAPLALEMSYGDDTSTDQYYDFSTGKIRYIIRTFPVGAIYTKVKPVQEFTFYKDLKDGFDHSVTLDFLVGDYDVMVWSDLIQAGDDIPCHNAENFGEISLLGAYAGNNEYRDAFRGTASVKVSADAKEPAGLKVEMERPLARYELISSDFPEFVGTQTKLASGEFTLADYTPVVFYVGYVPSVFSLYADKPVDSATGVCFVSSLTELNEWEVSLGFDYVFVGESQSSVTVQVGIYDPYGELVSMSSPTKVLLNRNECTIKSGSFLTSTSSDGVHIDKELDGNFSVPF